MAPEFKKRIGTKITGIYSSIEKMYKYYRILDNFLEEHPEYSKIERNTSIPHEYGQGGAFGTEYTISKPGEQKGLILDVFEEYHTASDDWFDTVIPPKVKVRLDDTLKDENLESLFNSLVGLFKRL
jgi:hypothetical protein